MNWKLFFGVIAVASLGSVLTVSAQDAAAERFKQRRAASPVNGAATSTAAVTTATPAENGDRASVWYERRLAMARGGRQAAAQTGSSSGQVDALGLTPEQRRELKARMDRDPRYRQAVIGYLQSMSMLQQTVISVGEANSRAIADRVRARERQVGGMRDRARDQQRRDQTYRDKVYEQRRSRGGY